jgi:hypothetical protein
MLSCRKLYQEISATLYTHQLFHVDLQPEQWPGRPRWTMPTRGMECTTENKGRHSQEKVLQFHGSRINNLIFELNLVHNKTCSDPETMSNPIMNANGLIHVCGEPQCIMQTYDSYVVVRPYVSDKQELQEGVASDIMEPINGLKGQVLQVFNSASGCKNSLFLTEIVKALVLP